MVDPVTVTRAEPPARSGSKGTLTQTWEDRRGRFVTRLGALPTGVQDRAAFTSKSSEQTLSAVKATAEGQAAGEERRPSRRERGTAAVPTSGWPLGGATAALVALGSGATAWLVLTGTGSVAPGTRTSLPAMAAPAPGSEVVVVPPLVPPLVPPFDPARGDARGSGRGGPRDADRPGAGSSSVLLALPALTPATREPLPATPAALTPARVAGAPVDRAAPEPPERPTAPGQPGKKAGKAGKPPGPPGPAPPRPAARPRPAPHDQQHGPHARDNVVPDRGRGHDAHHGDGRAKGHRHR